jgi:hypothetical protein
MNDDKTLDLDEPRQPALRRPLSGTKVGGGRVMSLAINGI